MSKYRKKPVEVEAMQYQREANIHEILDFANEALIYDTVSNEFFIKTLEGDMRIVKGDYVIKGVAGEFYPCKPDIFEKTYEKVVD